MQPITKAHIYSVSELNQLARITLEEQVGQLWISGEISNLMLPGSGHGYFSLKDKNAQIRCAIFKSSLQQLKFKPENGQHVVASARVSIYEPRGDFQLIVSSIALSGDGALQLAFEQLKKRLAAEGLFDAIYKKPIPVFPRTIGIITSATGAALRDILTVLKRRFSSIPVIIYPTLVQGKEAAPSIVNAITTANERQECEVLILARGGGSLEDLWPFNEEIVARSIFASLIPIVTGIGHEIDFTIADFVADLRAPTPSAAAEHVSPNAIEYLHRLQQLMQVLHKSISVTLHHLDLRLKHIQQRLVHPGQTIQRQMQQIDQLEQRLLLAQNYLAKQYLAIFNNLKLRFKHLHPETALINSQNGLSNLEKKLFSTIQAYLQNKAQQLQHTAHALALISPLTTLERGYAIVRDEKTKKIVNDSQKVKHGDILLIRVAYGEFNCKVT